MVSLEHYRVPSEPFRVLTAKYLQENGMHLEDFSAKCGFNESTMRKALTRPEIRFDLADKIMCESYGPLLWHRPPFEELYWQGNIPPDVSKPANCARPGCQEWFEVTASVMQGGRMYCSDECSHVVRNKKFRSTKRGKRTNRKNSSRDYYKHHEERLQRMRDYYEKNKEARKQYMRELRAKKRAA